MHARTCIVFAFCGWEDSHNNVDLSYYVQAHHLLMNFEEPLKDYVRAVQSIKVSLG